MKDNKFKSSFGFIMAAVGSAVGVGNLWGFPYKMGTNGGFAFLLCYLVVVAVLGFVVLQGEIVIGRRAGKGVVESYRQASKGAGWIGSIGSVAILLITGFCATLTAYCMKYFIGNVGTLLHASWGINGGDPAEYWANFLSNQGWQAALLTLLTVVLTVFIMHKGTSGIEKFCKYAMPALVGMLFIVIVKSLSLPGSIEGVKFMFKPDWSVFAGTGWISVFGRATGQAFFSLSLGMAIMITYGAYLKKDENIEKSAAMICFFDTLVALMAGVAIFPAVFAFGQEPAGGTALLFVTMQSVFNAMGAVGPLFGAILYLLVTIAELTSLVSMFEAPVAFITDICEEKRKKISRTTILMAVAAFNLLTGVIVAFDALGQGGLVQPLGFCWMDFFDLFSEGTLIPLGALAMTILIGWKLSPKWMADEIELEGNVWKTKKFTMFCMKWVAPVFLAFALVAQINGFFGLNWF
ncbi:MAG: sodium-dependent transporter [Bacillota bacterium]|nr:sodium-dependent transporter [Bacillota bacterium]